MLREVPVVSGFFGGRGRTRTGTPVSQKQILSLLCLPFHHAARTRSSACPGKVETGFPTKDMRQRKNPAHGPEAQCSPVGSILERVAPDAFPVLAAEVGGAAVLLMEFIGDLEHRQH